MNTNANHIPPIAREQAEAQKEWIRQKMLEKLKDDANGLAAQEKLDDLNVRIERQTTKDIAAKIYLESDDPFERVLGEILELRFQKRKDYGTGADPLNNLRASEEIGVPAWKGAWIRTLDKVCRINKFAREGKLACESVEDSFKDLAIYAMLCLALFRESKP